MRGESTHHRRRAEEAAQELAQGASVADLGKERLLATRHAVVLGWRAVSDQLTRQGQQGLAQAVRAFVAQLPPPRTERELIKATLLEKSRTRDSQELQR